MLKQILLILVPLFLFIGSPANANVLEWQQQKEQIQQERAELKKEIQEEATRKKGFLLPQEKKDQHEKKQIQLVMKDTKLAARERAYEQAINYMQPGQAGQLTAEQYFSFPALKIAPGQKVPAEFVPIYKAAAEAYGVDWFVLAAIHSIETNFSQIKLMVSSVGALGHMQFMPPTFAAYGVDGNGDGIKSPWNLEDSIYSAANYLIASGYKNDIRKAIWHYNHAEWYVNDVLARAGRIKNE